MNAVRTIRYAIALAATGLSVTAGTSDTGMLFTPLANDGGDQRIRSIVQLADGRPVFATVDGIEIYNGETFTVLNHGEDDKAELRTYDGFHHLYLTHDDRYLWVKDTHTLRCVDLDTERYADNPDSLLASLGCTAGADDVFGDGSGRLWVLTDTTLHAAGTETAIATDRAKMPLLDLAARGEKVYLFYGNGDVDCHDTKSGSMVYSASAFPDNELWKFAYTSQIAESGDLIYQIRNGGKGGLFCFDTKSRRWERIWESDIRLNTMAADKRTVLVSTSDGLLTFDRRTGETRHITMLRTRPGNLLASEVSTLAIDREGGIWLGLLNRGILHYHPDEFSCHTIAKVHGSGSPTAASDGIFAEDPDGGVTISDGATRLRVRFGDRDSIIMTEADGDPDRHSGEYGRSGTFVAGDGSLYFSEDDRYEIFRPDRERRYTGNSKPLVTSISVNGTVLSPGDGILDKSATRTERIELEHDRNFVTVCATSPHFDGSRTDFYYCLDGVDYGWNHAEGEGPGGRALKASYTALAPGNYTLRIKTSAEEDAQEARLGITVKAPWWRTKTAYFSYIILLVLIIAVALKAYAVRTRKRIEARQREENLLERIRRLIEEVDRYKAETPTDQPDEGIVDDASNDSEFIARAVETVEQNLGTPGYSVEQLSRDLCMDRTGLYRKLTAMLDKSPSLFIRDIRLRNAARLLKEGRLTVTEIAEQSGFSSTSYMSKCFQERYGCRPSEYARKDRE